MYEQEAQSSRLVEVNVMMKQDVPIVCMLPATVHVM